jgi:hypothetical protein
MCPFTVTNLHPYKQVRLNEEKTSEMYVLIGRQLNGPKANRMGEGRLNASG